MSSSGSSAEPNDNVEPEAVLMYSCKKCPGVLLDAHEMDAHREYHKRMKKRKLRNSRRSERISSRNQRDSSFMISPTVASPSETLTQRPDTTRSTAANARAASGSQTLVVSKRNYSKTDEQRTKKSKNGGG